MEKENPELEGGCGVGEEEERRKTLVDEDFESYSVAAFQCSSEVSGSNMGVSHVSMEERMDMLEQKLESLYGAMSEIRERLTELINRSNSDLEENASKRDVITASRFEGFVDQAILAGHEIGVGRSFIQEYLLRTFSIQPSKYVQRRLGAVLRRRVASGAYKLENNLYSFVKE